MDATISASGAAWNYVQDGKPSSPVPESQIPDLISGGAITPETLVWSQGMSDWAPASSTLLARHFHGSSGAAPASWCYLQADQQPSQPVEEGEMIRLLRQGHLKPYSQVWTEGMQNWEPVAQTPLAAFLPQHSQPGAVTRAAQPLRPQPARKPPSMSLEDAEKHIKNAAITGCISFAITVVVALITEGWLLIFAFILAGLTFGTYKRSRVCATILFSLFLLDKILTLAEGELGISSATVGLVFLYYYFMGMLGTFAFHRWK